MDNKTTIKETGNSVTDESKQTVIYGSLSLFILFLGACTSYVAVLFFQLPSSTNASSVSYADILLITGVFSVASFSSALMSRKRNEKHQWLTTISMSISSIIISLALLYLLYSLLFKTVLRIH